MTRWSTRFGAYLLCTTAAAGAFAFLACGGTSDDAPAEAKDAAPETGPVTDAADASVADAHDASDAREAATDSGVASTLYYGELLSVLAAGRLDRTFKFYTEVTYEQEADAGEAGVPGIIAKISLTAIKSSATTVAKTDTTGSPIVKMTVPVSPSGRYVAAMGTLTIPGDANPISGRVVVIENVVLSGGFSRPLRFCSAFDGHVTQPTDIVLTGDQSTMIYDEVTEGATQPVHTAGDFAAGCPVPAE